MIKRISLYVILLLASVFLLVNFTSTGKENLKDQSKVNSGQEDILSNTGTVYSGIELMNHDNVQKDFKEEGVFTDFKAFLNTKYLALRFATSKSEKEKYINQKNIHSFIFSGEWSKLKMMLELYGYERVLEKLLAESDEGSKFNCHNDAHYVGRFSFLLFKGEALKNPTTICGSGYIHGALGTLIRYMDMDRFPKDAVDICQSFNTGFERMECYHSSGHGVMGAVNGDLPKAIDLCNLYEDGFRSINCYVGAFMENYAPVSKPEIFPPKTKWIDAKNPHFPCNTFKDNFNAQVACYGVQFPWVILRLMKQDIRQVARECMNAEKNLIPYCLFGYGQYAALVTSLDIEKTINLCMLPVDDDQLISSCIQGGEALILDFWGLEAAKKGKEYCDAVPEKYRGACNNFLDERLEQI